ncbi:PmoA family protein [Algoriphagus halophytocola]|uniref:PmoA family protein n=1 Tax=Algoriphagus halophytocola TaxID=2991499 RepID=A0ABY6MJ56_9BACT|nr:MULTISPECIES: PmoA family protein [unclassified Algoriphagus]UZD23805.1 PmoA family protein [Algoriphagus sp. TR-M5]WBL41172.1 PmoA family protein [Algoriphagus sp. TR-M9]
MIFKRIFCVPALYLCLMVPVLAQKVTLNETNNGIDFVIDNQTVLTYQTAVAEVPEGVKKDFAKSGFIHPLKSPSGQVLTRIQPKDHYHHYGIWGPWTRATISGREVDFWNLGDGKGRVDFAEVLSKKQNRKGAELVVRQNHLDLKAPESERLAIAEDLKINVKPADKGRYMVDYTSTIETSIPGGIMLDAYRYGGGIGFRATEKWGKDNSSALTSEGKVKKEADGTNARWIFVQGETNDASGESGILFLSHKDNKSHPEPLRVWPVDQYDGEGNVFIEFTPIRHESWEIKPNKPYSLKYRMIVYDGEMTAEEAEAYWQSFVK